MRRVHDKERMALRLLFWRYAKLWWGGELCFGYAKNTTHKTSENVVCATKKKGASPLAFFLHLESSTETSGECQAVGVFEVAADGEAGGESCYFYREFFKDVLQVQGGGVAFQCRV